MLIKTVIQGALAALLVAGAAAAYAAASGPPAAPESAPPAGATSDGADKSPIRSLFDRIAGEDEEEGETQREGRAAPVAEGKFERKGER